LRVSSWREPERAGQAVAVIGGSAGIGLGAARRARAEGADVILTGRHPGRLPHAAVKIGARQTGAFDANDPAALDLFFLGLPSRDPGRPKAYRRCRGARLNRARRVA
jgi:NAD(P)-dependent dehydrogenase (short-subunit alcohol dehydrogenase family)